jgi:hypothetical protein
VPATRGAGDARQVDRTIFGAPFVGAGVVRRAMFGLIIIVIIVYLIAMRPFRLAIRSCMRKVSDLFVRKP